MTNRFSRDHSRDQWPQDRSDQQNPTSLQQCISLRRCQEMCNTTPTKTFPSVSEKEGPDLIQQEDRGQEAIRRDLHKNHPPIILHSHPFRTHPPRTLMQIAALNLIRTFHSLTVMRITSLAKEADLLEAVLVGFRLELEIEMNRTDKAPSVHSATSNSLSRWSSPSYSFYCCSLSVGQCSC
eukprot:TRINITY_DN2679_c0_g1::TRINITY_DN2679_c0_g1_i1::g.26196::m.26196 TRINITY_DN2679_c0_g1::TRINITY_DN2679_c0_g1_i1::g.26196  ORF type:complete len:181 (-),score=-9.06,Uds1/PF15456.1/1.5e+03,Uds1/PF15456.1/0.18 TRINITY_DN2679_c0_g1_i1:377-919(-)